MNDCNGEVSCNKCKYKCKEYLEEIKDRDIKMLMKSYDSLHKSHGAFKNNK